MPDQTGNENAFYKNNYNKFLLGLIVALFILILSGGIVHYQVLHRPLPIFVAVNKDGKQLVLAPGTEPNLLSSTIINWARQAAITAYTFNFSNYNEKLERMRPLFTEAGWANFRASINPVISTILQNQLIVSGVVTGAPIIANQGPYPGHDYVWRVQLPYLVTYQSANSLTSQKYLMVLTIVRIPTTVNPTGIGIDGLLMV